MFVYLTKKDVKCCRCQLKMPRKSVDKGSVEKPATRKSVEPAKPDLKAEVKASPEKCEFCCIWCIFLFNVC